MDTRRRTVVEDENGIVVGREPGIAEIRDSVRTVSLANVRVQFRVVNRKALSFEDDDQDIIC
jgi:hypothetical protein